jgi:hypothetical protein
MPSPFIFIATNRLKAGRLDRERERVPDLVDFIEANEPRLIAFNEYVNEAGDEVSVVQVHPDAASMEAHMEIVRERAQAAYAETLDATVRIQVFGEPTQAILETLRQQAGSGVEITSTASTSEASLARPPSAEASRHAGQPVEHEAAGDRDAGTRRLAAPAGRPSPAHAAAVRRAPEWASQAAMSSPSSSAAMSPRSSSAAASVAPGLLGMRSSAAAANAPTTAMAAAPMNAAE